VGKCGTDRQPTDENTIRRMRFACWINKATDTHSKYVIIFIAFPLQQWLRERAFMFRYNYIASLLIIKKNVIILVWAMRADCACCEFKMVFRVSFKLI
jgi:hypothetical protein